jgi:2-phospho-L-lactate guanylyltransferase
VAREPAPVPADAHVGGAATDAWGVVIPVKRLPLAKTRLAPLPAELRHELALAMAVDTIAAAVRTPGVRVVVVTDDAEAGDAASLLGAAVIPDAPDAGINAALLHGAASLRVVGTIGIAALSGDLPALRPAALRRALTRAGSYDTSYVPDLAGTGTVLYAARSLPDFRPTFGADSRARHGAQAVELAVDGLDSLRQDVDTLADFEAAMVLGLGSRTAAITPRLADWMPTPRRAGAPDESARHEDQVREEGRCR